MDDDFFHPAQREVQQMLATADMATRIADTRLRRTIEGEDEALVREARFFFLATRAPDGTLDASIKCGPVGFVTVDGPSRIVFPDYDGNGMFRSLGNIRATADVALLFVELSGRKRKLRVQGRGHVEVCAPAQHLPATAGDQARVCVTVTRVFPNCPRYLPSMEWAGDCDHVSALGREPLEPDWKRKPDLAPWVAPRRVY